MKVLLALLGAFFVFPVVAADWPVVSKDSSYNRMSGTRVTLSDQSTQEVVNFGFSTSAVRICLIADANSAGQSNPVYMRIGTTLTATQSSDFIDGDGNQGANPAAVLSFGGDGTDTQCEIYPLQVRGLIFHNTTSATVDVSAFD